MIVLDIDDTIANSRWREELKSDSWDAYHAACVKDMPIHNVIRVLEALSDKFNLVALTSRPEKFRTATCLWLSVHCPFISDVMMREDVDWRPAPQIKRDMVLGIPGVHLAIDSRDDVCAAYRALGLTTAQVHSWR